MMPNDQIIAGQLVLVTEGAYSDFRVVGLYRANRDFDMADQMKLWRGKVNHEGKEYRDNLQGFAEQLVIDGLLSHLDYNEQDLGAYNMFDRQGLNLAQVTA